MCFTVPGADSHPSKVLLKVHKEEHSSRKQASNAGFELAVRIVEKMPQNLETGTEESETVSRYKFAAWRGKGTFWEAGVELPMPQAVQLLDGYSESEVST